MTTFKTLAGVVVMLCSTSALAQAGGWTITEASGRVVVRDAGGERVVGRGAAVPAGATLATGPGARAVVVRGEDFVTVAANSRLRVPTAVQATGMLQLIEEWGNAVFKIKKQAKPHFAVQTPYMAAVVKGTTFSITVGAEGASLQVIEGAVEVATTDGGARDLVLPGAVATVTAADRYRLSVQGQQKRDLDSPARGAAPSTVAPAPSVEPAALTIGFEDMAAPEGSVDVIDAPIEARPVDLAALTGGLVSGKATAVLVAALVAKDAARDAAIAEELRAAAEKAAEQAAIARAAEDAAKAADKAAKDAEKDRADKAAEANKAAKDAEAAKDAQKAADDAAKAAKDAEAAKDAQKAADDAAKAAKDAEQAARDAEAEKAARDAEAEKAAKDAERAAKDAEDAKRAADDAAKDAEADRKAAEEAAKDKADKDEHGDDKDEDDKDGDDGDKDGDDDAKDGDDEDGDDDDKDDDDDDKDDDDDDDGDEDDDDDDD